MALKTSIRQKLLLVVKQIKNKKMSKFGLGRILLIDLIRINLLSIEYHLKHLLKKCP